MTNKFQYDKKLFRNIKHPPIEARSKLLHKYYDDLLKVDTVVALIKYKQSMHFLYKEYNPWIRPVKITVNNWQYN